MCILSDKKCRNYKLMQCHLCLLSNVDVWDKTYIKTERKINKIFLDKTRLVCLSSNCGALLRLFLVPRMMMTASWPSMVFFTSSLLSTSPTSTLDALWSGGSLAGSRTSTVTLYPDGGNTEMTQINGAAETGTHGHVVSVMIMQPNNMYTLTLRGFTSCRIS